jgi:hypothetical protein
MQNATTAPTFAQSFERSQGTQITTPYGVVTISNGGRRVTFDLWEDVRQSIHHKALFSYYQQLTKKGISNINCDHIELPGLNRSLSLKRGKARLDCVYTHKGKTVEVELKTHREIGLDVTRIQLAELVKHCQNLIVVVPRQDMENAHVILQMIGLEKRVTIDTYELFEEEGE